MIKEFYLSGISFLEVPPRLQFLWRDTLYGHCTSKWSCLDECRMLYRLDTGDDLTFIKAVGSYEQDGDHEWAQTDLTFGCNRNLMEEWPDTLDPQSTLYSVFWFRDFIYNTFTAWKIAKTYFDAEGNFVISSRVKHYQNLQYWNE